MDLTRNLSPLPPAPIAPAVTPPAVLSNMPALEAAIGQSIPVRLVAGNVPSLDIAPAHLVAASMFLRDQLGFSLLSCVSGADMGDHLQVVYHVRNLETNWLLQLSVAVPTATNEVESVMGVWPTANWLERETYDMYGIIFTGHPDLRRILLDDEFEGFPLLKSFRPTPLTRHDPATTQVSPQQAVAGAQQRGLGPQRAIPNILSQGESERLHPGTPTFGSTQFHGREFPPQTWKHLQGPPPAENEQKPR